MDCIIILSNSLVSKTKLCIDSLCFYADVHFTGILSILNTKLNTVQYIKNSDSEFSPKQYQNSVPMASFWIVKYILL